MKNKKLYWLRNGKLKRCYVYTGRPWKLQQTYGFLSGLRKKLESFVLCFQWYVYPFKSICRAQKINETWMILNEVVKIQDAFLLDTSWYKNTVFIGAVRDQSGKEYFVKFYQDRHEATYAVEQSAFMKEYFSNYFQILKIVSPAQWITFSPLIQHNTDKIPFSEIWMSIHEFSNDFYQKYYQNIKPLISFIHHDLAQLLKHHENTQDLWLDIQKFLHDYQDLTIPMVPTHGDLVPWNLFYDQNGVITLIDYERCGWHVPYYDFFHLIVQTGAIKGHICDLNMLWADVPHIRAKVVIWFVLYMLDQLQYDLNSYYRQKQQYTRLKKMINIKINLLKSALGEINKGDG